MWDKFLMWLFYRNLTPAVLWRGSEKVDLLRKQIKCSTGLILSQLAMSYQAKAILAEKKIWRSLPTADGVKWVIHYTGQDHSTLAMCCEDHNGLTLFSTLRPNEIRADRVAAVHGSLKKVIRQVAFEFDGTALSLAPFRQVLNYKV